MVALAGIRRVFHFAQQRVHLFRLADGAPRAPSHGRPWWPRHASAAAPAAAPRPIPPCARRDRAAAPRHPSCRAATASRARRPRRDRRTRSRARTRPAPRRAPAAARRVASSSSTISGISRICRCTPFFESDALQPLIDDALMRGVLVDDDQAVAGLRHDIGLVDLRARRAERPIDQVGRRLRLEAHVGRRRADIEGRLVLFGKRGGAGKGRHPADGIRRRALPVPIAGPRRDHRAERGDCRAAAIGRGALALARQPVLQRMHDQRAHQAGIAETHFRFRRMHVGVDLARIAA